ncbi:MAG: hypothetical protein R3F49_15305 [Planctomycetota bacterium]
MKHGPLHLARLLLVLALASCRSGPEPVWAADRFEAHSERMLWDVLRIALDHADFKVGGGAEPEARRIESGWKVDASPFKGQGWRKKARVEYAPAPDAEGAWDVKVRVQMDTNESFKGIDLRYADWQPAPDDEVAAKRVLQFARSLLGGGEFEVGPERRGVPTSRERMIEDLQN